MYHRGELCHRLSPYQLLKRSCWLRYPAYLVGLIPLTQRIHDRAVFAQLLRRSRVEAIGELFCQFLVLGNYCAGSCKEGWGYRLGCCSYAMLATGPNWTRSGHTITLEPNTVIDQRTSNARQAIAAYP